MDTTNPTTGRLCLFCVIVLIAGAALWGWDIYRLRRRPRTTRKPCSDEEQFLDALAMEVDRRLLTEKPPVRRPAGPSEARP